MLKVVLACFFLLLSLRILAGGASSEALEPIYLKSIQPEFIIFKAKSSGCTNEEDFFIDVQGRDISIRRNKKDRCRKKPYWKDISLPLALDSRETQVFLRNPIPLRLD